MIVDGHGLSLTCPPDATLTRYNSPAGITRARAITVTSQEFTTLATHRCELRCRLQRHGSGSILSVEVERGPSMIHPTAEISIDLTAQDLTDPSNVAPIEVDDIREFDPLLQPAPAANQAGAARSPTDPMPDPALDEDTIEVEIDLSADQVDALLSGKLP